MKIRMIVIDPELSRRAKRAWAILLVPVLVAGAGAVAYASVPHVWKNGDVLDAADLNANFAKVPTTTEWKVANQVQCVDQVGSPTTSQTTEAVWRRVGDTMQIRVKTSFSASPTSEELFWTIPENHAVEPSKVLGTTRAGSGTFRGYDLWVFVDGTGNPNVVRAMAGTGKIGGFNPGVGAGDEIQLEFSVPIKGWSLNGP
jgi:hypothetical protein